MTPVSESEWEPSSSSWALVVLAWLAVGLPLLWGVFTTIKKAAVLFR